MSPRPFFRPCDAVALRYLRYLVLRDGGYRRRGVLGWATRQDVESAIATRLPERLSRLHAKGLLDREDVRAHPSLRPAWIYRITQAGSDVVAERERLPRRAIPPLRAASEDQPDSTVYIPPGVWITLQVLRGVMEVRATTNYLPGEPGWCTYRELRARIMEEDDTSSAGSWEGNRRDSWRGTQDDKPPEEPWRAPGLDQGWVGELADEASRWEPLDGETPTAPRPSLMRKDMVWLVRTGLVQHWMGRSPGGRRVPLYRITNLGGVVIPLEWHAPR